MEKSAGRWEVWAYLQHAPMCLTQSDAPKPHQVVPGLQEAQVGYVGFSFHFLSWHGRGGISGTKYSPVQEIAAFRMTVAWKAIVGTYKDSFEPLF